RHRRRRGRPCGQLLLLLRRRRPEGRVQRRTTPGRSAGAALHRRPRADGAPHPGPRRTRRRDGRHHLGRRRARRHPPPRVNQRSDTWLRRDDALRREVPEGWLVLADDAEAPVLLAGSAATIWDLLASPITAAELLAALEAAYVGPHDEIAVSTR